MFQKQTFGTTSTGSGTGFFGATTTQAPASGTNTSTFGFGTNTQKELMESSAVLFGAKPATSGFGAPASSAFGSFGAAPGGLFGAKPQQTTAPTSGAEPQQTTAPPFGVQLQQTTAPPFGAEPQQTTAPPSGAEPQLTTAPPFGVQPQQTTAPPFGVQPQQTTAPPFGVQPQQTTAPTFESKPQQTTVPTFESKPQQTTVPTFGVKPQQTTAPPFGAEPQQTTAPPFGVQPQQTTAPTFGSSAPGTGLFGATTQAPAFGTNTSTFGFGTNTQKEHKEPSAGLFGAKPATSGFGAPSSSSFGAPSSSSFGAPSSSSFGAPASSSFVAPASSAFGSFGATPGGLFGAKPQQTTAPIFVSSAPASSTTPHNTQPLRFHAVHRESMRISRDGRAVKPAYWMGNGVLFSARPVRIFEKVCFCLRQISDDSAIFFGFTSYDPTTLTHELTLDTIRFMNKPGNCYRFLNRRFYKKDNILSYYFDSAGKVHFEVNWCHKEELLFSVDTNNSLWVLVYLVDIALQFIDPEDPKQVKGCTQNPFEEERRREEAEEVLPPPRYPDPLEPLSLHKTKGRNVQFVNEVAERIGLVSSQGYVFTALPMRLGQTIVVQILATRLFFKGSLSIGLTSCDPATLRPCDLPNNVIDLLDRPEYWVVRQNAADHLKRGDELAVTLSIDGEVQVCVNGSNTVTVAHVDCTVRLWAFVDIYGVTQKVRLLSSKATRAETPPQQLRDVASSATLTPTKACEIVTSLPQIDAPNAANRQYIEPSVGLFSAKPATSGFCAPASSAFGVKPQQTTAPTFSSSAPDGTTETRELTIRQPSDRESIECTSSNGRGPQPQSTGSLQSDSPALPSPPSPAHFPSAPSPSPSPSTSAPTPSPAYSPSGPTPSAPTLSAPSPSVFSRSAPSFFPAPSSSAASPSSEPFPSAPTPSPPAPSAPSISAPAPAPSLTPAPYPSPPPSPFPRATAAPLTPYPVHPHRSRTNSSSDNQSPSPGTNDLTKRWKSTGDINTQRLLPSTRSHTNSSPGNQSPSPGTNNLTKRWKSAGDINTQGVLPSKSLCAPRSAGTRRT